MRRASYRPFTALSLYQSPLFIGRPGATRQMFPPKAENLAICFEDAGSRTEYCVLAVDGAADLHFGSAVDGYQQVPLYTYDDDGRRTDNMTEWGLSSFGSISNARKESDSVDYSPRYLQLCLCCPA